MRVVRTKTPGQEFGWTNLGRSGFRIVVREKLVEANAVRDTTLAEMRDTIIHEWAHVLAWTPEHPSLEDHDPAWAIRYSQAYQAVIGD